MIWKKILTLIFWIGFGLVIQAQSFEIMPGVQRIFIDAQYLKFLDHEGRISLFSRARATAEYDRQASDLFTGAYLNFSTRSGLGVTLLGRIATHTSGVDAGLHYFRSKRNWMLYALPSINLGDELIYSWFSILRYTPELSEEWKLFSSLELFSAFAQMGHLNSVQRFRVGLDKKGYQFGLAINLNQSRFSETDVNPGAFFRKQF